MNSEEKEISLVDLFWQFLKGWRLIIVFAVIFAILAGVYKYHADATSIKNTEDSQSVSIENLQSDLTEEDTKSVEKASKIKNQLLVKQKYADNSILMQIDPYAENQYTLQYTVNTGYVLDFNKAMELDYTSKLVNSYVSFIENGGMSHAMIKELQWDMDESNLGELVSADIQTGVSNSWINSANTITVFAKASDEESCAELGKAIQDALNDYQITLADTIGTHTLTLVDSYQSTVSDTTLADKQLLLETSIIDLQDKLTTLKSAMTDNAIAVLEDENTGEDTVELQTASISLKYIFLGAIFGMMAVCVWVTVIYIISNNVKTVEEVQDIYGLRVFGKVKLQRTDVKRFGNKLDTWLDKKCDKDELTPEEQLNFVMTNLCVTCKEINVSKIFITTTLHLKEQEQQILECICGKLGVKNIDVIFEENMIQNAKAIEQMSAIGNIVLIERINSTTSENLVRELQICKEHRTEVLGTIVLN